MQTPININNFLPHRAPMLMVDLVMEINDERVTSVFTINEDNIFVENGIFAESGLIENAAQTCSAIVGKQYFFDEDDEANQDVNIIGFISAIKTMKIHILPKTGTTITTKVELGSKFVSDDYTICTVNCRTFDKELLLLEGEINLFIQETGNEKERSAAR